MRGFGSARRRLVLLTVGAVTLATAPARAQRAARIEDFLGVTRCDSGQAVTEIREDVRRSDLRAEVEAHEAVHREQAAVYGGCEAFLASLTTARRIIALVRHFLAATGTPIRKKNVDAASFVAFQSVRATMLASLLETPAGFNDQTMVEEVSDLLLRYLVEDEWLAQQEDLIAIRPRNPEDRPITITADQSSMVRWFTLAIVPALLMLNAVRVYWRRR